MEKGYTKEVFKVRILVNGVVLDYGEFKSKDAAINEMKKLRKIKKEYIETSNGFIMRKSITRMFIEKDEVLNTNITKLSDKQLIRLLNK